MLGNFEMGNIRSSVKQVALSSKVVRHSAYWRGASGRDYGLSKQGLEDFTLNGEELYILVADKKACWIGRANDLIANEVSRARFKVAIKVANFVFRLEDDSDERSKMGIIWDIEGGNLCNNAGLHESRFAKLKLLT